MTENRKFILWCVISAIFVLMTFAAMFFITFSSVSMALATGIIGWAFASFWCMASLLKHMHLKHSKENLTRALTSGVELAHKLGECQSFSQQLLQKREHIIMTMGKPPEKKIKN